MYPDAAKEGGKESKTYDPYFMDDVRKEIGMDYDEIPDYLWTQGSKNFVEE